MTFNEVAAFHGHRCPGLAMGFRMAAAGLEALSDPRAGDEELVAVVENDACGVDALQCLTGCTFGKGNLVFRDYGKSVYTLYSRRTGRGVRVVFHGRGMPDMPGDDRDARLEWILEAPLESMISVTPVLMQEPGHARIRSSVVCTRCGEKVMETRIRMHCGSAVCIPCHEGLETTCREAGPV